MLESLAGLLTQTTGSAFLPHHPGTWPGYIESVRESRYQLLFDEPHLVSWRVENLQHVPLVRLPGTIGYVVIAREDDNNIVQLKDLAGYVVCATVPPALGSLVLLQQFPNPSRQPVLRRTGAGLEAYRGLLTRKCRGAVLTQTFYERFALRNNETRVLFLSEPFANWALSADPAIPAQLQEQIRQVLLDPANSLVTQYLNYGTDTKKLVPTGPDEYRGYADLLKDFWGFQ